MYSRATRSIRAPLFMLLLLLFLYFFWIFFIAALNPLYACLKISLTNPKDVLLLLYCWVYVPLEAHLILHRVLLSKQQVLIVTMGHLVHDMAIQFTRLLHQAQIQMLLLWLLNSTIYFFFFSVGIQKKTRGKVIYQNTVNEGKCFICTICPKPLVGLQIY